MISFSFSPHYFCICSVIRTFFYCSIFLFYFFSPSYVLYFILLVRRDWQLSISLWQTLPLINPRSCYCKQNTTYAHVWAKRNGQSGQITYMIPVSDCFVWRGLWTPSVCLYESVNVWKGQGPSPPFSNYTISVFCLFSKISQAGDLQCSRVYKPIENARMSLIHFWNGHADASCSKSWVQARERCCTSVQALPFSRRGNPFLD